MHPNTHNAADNMRGSLFMLLAMASFALGDTIIKLVNSVLPLSQILVIRGCFAIVLFFAITAWFNQLRPVKIIFRKAFLLRLLGEVIAALFFLTALFNMPMANAAAIMQAIPLTVSLGAAYFFGETIGWRRILAIVVGFIGVLMIVQPGAEGFTVYSIYCLIAVGGTTLRDLATRRLPNDVPNLFVGLITVIVVVLMGLVLALFETWQPVSTNEVAALAGASVFMVTGFVGIVAGMRVGEVGVVTPLRYSILIFAVILGFLVFNELPNTLTVIGAFVVVGSGLFTLYRETVTARTQRQAGKA